MSHLAENLASKGFVTVSIDHKESTYDDQKPFASTLYNRAFDQLFVLNEMDAARPAPGSGSFLSGRLDASRTGIVGYSMGGYGAVNVIGGGYSKASETIAGAPPNRMLAERGADNPEYRKTMDPRIKAAIAIAPWGMAGGFWDADGLKGITTPVLFVAGSVDDVAGYEKGTKAIYQARRQRRSVSADVHQRQPQRRRADSGASRDVRAGRARQARGLCALRGCRVGYRPDEQHPRSFRDGLLRLLSQGRSGEVGTSTDGKGSSAARRWASPSNTRRQAK